MLGEQIGEASGTITGIRVLDGDGDDHKMEVSFRGAGELLGVGFTDLGTFTQRVRPGGIFTGEDAHVVMLTEDGEMAPGRGLASEGPRGRGSLRVGEWQGLSEHLPRKWRA